MCLSGGGIRSATFALGVLQGLHRSGMLRAFDYLSTVSGGGFIGAWWMAWLHRNPADTFPPAEQIALNRPESRKDSDAECIADSASAGMDPVHHLRLYSNYLTPRKGLLSGDTWRAGTIIVRNLALTWLVLIPFLFAAVLIADTYFVLLDPTWLLPDTRVLPWSWRMVLWLAPVAALLGWLAVAVLAWLEFARLGGLRRSVPYLSPLVPIILVISLVGFSGLSDVADRTWELVRDRQGGWILALWSVSALLWFLWLRLVRRDWAAGGALLKDDEMRARATWWQIRLAIVSCAVFVILGVAGLGHELIQYLYSKPASSNWLMAAVENAGGPLAILAAVGGSVYTAIRTSPSASVDARGEQEPSALGRLILRITPTVVLGILLLFTALATHQVMVRVAEVGGAVATVVPLLSLGLGVFVFTCAVYAWQESGAEVFTEDDRSRIRGYAMLCWLLLFTAAARSVTVQQAINRLQVDLPFLSLPVHWVLAAVAGLCAVCAVFSLTLKRSVDNHRPAWCLFSAFSILGVAVALHLAERRDALIVVSFLGTVLAWIVTFGWLVDPNQIALHSFYKVRLLRAYLGASNRERAIQSKYITDTDDQDDVKLSALRTPETQGPYPLINTTLNLVGGRDLKSAQRSSDRFVLSPLFCGSSRTRYRRTEKYMSDGMTLGTAVAISGAAVSPTMGAVSPTAALSALMTLLNVRLGYWAPTPNKSGWQQPGATLWPIYAIFELTSQTNELGANCYLTDGGHFDNTGLYSLVERGCRNILFVDCGADPGPCFEDLGTAIRRCRIDFGTEIDIDLSAALTASPDGRHFLAGKITYSKDHAEVLGLDVRSREGVLVAIKPRVLHADESADVRQYKIQNRVFPQQVTSDQWFDEAQFESYRKLGETSANGFLASLQPELSPLREAAFDTADCRRSLTRLTRNTRRASPMAMA